MNNIKERKNMKKLTAVLLALLMAAVCTMALAEGEQDALAKLKEKAPW